MLGMAAMTFPAQQHIRCDSVHMASLTAAQLEKPYWGWPLSTLG